jgi:hypothetical protein
MKEQMTDIVLYVDPSTSLCVFIAWMHCVYTNSTAYVPVYFAAGITALLLRNYFQYGTNDEFNHGFTPITIIEIFNVLLYGGPNTKYIKPIKVNRGANSTVGNTVGEEKDRAIIHTAFQRGVGLWQMDGDHVEFPVSASLLLANSCDHFLNTKYTDMYEVFRSWPTPEKNACRSLRQFIQSIPRRGGRRDEQQRFLIFRWVGLPLFCCRCDEDPAIYTAGIYIHRSAR